MTDKKIQVRSTEEALSTERALKLALESAAGLALEVLKKHRQMKGEYPMGMLGVRAVEELEAVFSEMDEALAEQPAQQQEPVCNKDPQGCWSVRCQLGKVCKNKYPPASKPWVGLTDEEIQKIWRNSEHMTVNQVCRAIEAKLREKNA